MNSLPFLKRFVREYCLNSTLSSLSYLVDLRFHYTERLFWLLCMVLSIFVSYSLVNESLIEFNNDSVSLTVESFPFNDITYFPSIAVCETIGPSAAHRNPGMPCKIHNFESYKQCQKIINFVAYISSFDGKIVDLNALCSEYKDCENCTKCPKSNYTSLAAKVRLTCSKLLTHCEWNETPFDCCKYFLPIQTTFGECFVVNSIQTTDRFSDKWFPIKTAAKSKLDTLLLNVSQASVITMLNEEDIPHINLKMLQIHLNTFYTYEKILLRVQLINNDNNVRKSSKDARDCIYPDEYEQFQSDYKYYSYSVCMTDCLKRLQIMNCNCSHFILHRDTDQSPPCNFDGMICLHKMDLIYPNQLKMQPWRHDGLKCKCQPSCTENEITIIGQQSMHEWAGADYGNITRTIEIQQIISNLRYRRQLIRDKLDIFVAIGGILSLFLGASFLSGLELFYHFYRALRA